MVMEKIQIKLEIYIGSMLIKTIHCLDQKNKK